MFVKKNNSNIYYMNLYMINNKTIIILIRVNKNKKDGKL